MGPEPVVACGDTNAGPEVQQDGEDQGGALQWCVVREVAGYQRDEDKQGGLEPINVQVPVGQRPRHV